MYDGAPISKGGSARQTERAAIRLPKAPPYPDEWRSRIVSRTGQMKWGGHDIQIAAALRGERIGLKPIGDGVWEIYFLELLLGTFHERGGLVKALKKNKQ